VKTQAPLTALRTPPYQLNESAACGGCCSSPPLSLRRASHRHRVQLLSCVARHSLRRAARHRRACQSQWRRRDSSCGFAMICGFTTTMSSPKRPR
jgi:hypothetical protein